MKNILSLVSVIIVNWNGKELLSACLSSLSKITYKNIEIIIVDNGSSDGSIEMVEKFSMTNDQFSIKLIKNKENLGFAEGNNIGLRQAKGEYVLLLNNDTEVEKSFLEPLIEEMQANSKAAVVQPKIIFSLYQKLQAGGSFFTRNGFLNPVGFFKDPNDPEFNQKMKIFSANGACMLIRKKVIEKTEGLFDSDFFAYYEETDFCWRAILAGYEIIYEPKSVIFHKGRQTSIKLSTGLTQYLSFKNRLSSMLENLSLVELIKILPLHFLFSIVWIVGFFGLGKYSCAFSIPKAYLWNILNLHSTLKKRAIIQSKVRIISDAQWLKIYKKDRQLKDYLLFFYKIDKYKG